MVVSASNLGRDNSWGNLGYSTITAPGNDPYVITVGAMRDMGTATRSDDRVASYSSKGPTLIDHIVKPDLVAPGNVTVSTASTSAYLTTHYPGNWAPYSYYLVNGPSAASATYFKLSGASMAASIVSGAAAL